MYSNPVNFYTDKPSVSIVAVLTALFGFGCIMLGYLFLPLAAAFYAILLFFENKNSKILSYVIPVAIFAVNILINGFCSLEGVAYVLCGAIMYISLNKNRSKSETAVILSFAVGILMIISLFLLAFDEVGALRISAVKEFYTEVYFTQKSQFINFVTSFKRVNEDGITLYLLNSAEAEELFNSILVMIVPLFCIIAFLISGISLKIFSSRLLKYSSSKEKVAEWSFTTTTFVAYFYVFISILAIVSDSGILGQVISSLDLIFLVVFGYIGAKVFFTVLAATKGKGFSVLVFIVAFLLFSSIAIRILSYLGVYFTIVTNKAKNNS